MIVAVDAGCLGVSDERLKVGVFTVVKNLLIELGRIDKKNSYILYSFYSIEKELMQQFGPKMKNVIVRPMRGWLKIALPLWLLFNKPDVLLASNQALPFRLPGSKYKTVGIFYDIAFEKYPQLFSYAASVERHKHNSRYLATHADKLVAISKTTRDDVQKIYHVSADKIVIAYPGFDIGNEVSSYKSKNPYFLFVGAFKKSKNVPTLIRAFVHFLKLSKKQYELLLVGGDKWMDPEITNVLQRMPKDIVQRIHLFGHVDSKKLASLYKGANAFVSPSWYEGFGLTFLEAQSLDCPVIASKGGSLPEILGKSALFVDPKNSNKLTQAMLKVTTDKKIRQQLIAKGRENSKRYSWKLFAKTVQSAIESVV